MPIDVIFLGLRGVENLTGRVTDSGRVGSGHHKFFGLVGSKNFGSKNFGSPGISQFLESGRVKIFYLILVGSGRSSRIGSRPDPALDVLQQTLCTFICLI